MPESQSTPPQKRKRRSSTTRFLRSAVAAGFSVNSIEFDPNTGKFTVSVDKPGKGNDAEVEQWLSKQNAHQG